LRTGQVADVPQDHGELSSGHEFGSPEQTAAFLFSIEAQDGKMNAEFLEKVGLPLAAQKTDLTPLSL
jgi:hypothetical protein